MDIKQYYFNENEKPLDRLPADGGFAGIFRTIACVGDSLSSGEFESVDNDGNPGYHDMFEYSWGQYLGRLIGSKVYNFSRGGMTAEEYCRSFAEANGFWDESKKADCYIVALGVNDIINAQRPVGSLSDIDFHDPEKSAETFAGWYGKLILRYKAIQPDAFFFLVGIPKSGAPYQDSCAEEQTAFLYQLADTLDHTFVIDLYHYAPVYDDEFARNFFMRGHMNAAGYLLTSRMIASYIDYYVRKYPRLFSQVPFIGSELYRRDYES